jgi:hypothetical protein
MTRSGSFILCATLGGGLFACGSSDKSSKDPLDLVPQDNDVSGWTVDKANAKDPTERAMSATTYDQVVALIDGGAEDFFIAPNTPTLFLWQNYLNSTLPSAPPDPPDNPVGAKIKLYILQMPSVDQAKGLYTAILQQPNYTRKKGTSDDWQDPTTPLVGTASRIQDTGSAWWINFRKDVFYVQVSLSPSYGPPPDYAIHNDANKQEAFRFAQYIASKI